MDLSIVIVNYNVKYFLEQCLHSVHKAIKGMNTEVFVVDNNSVDGSCVHVKEKFPWVKLIENHDNVGFSKANNQAIRVSNGRYILLLNPDTVVEEDTFSKCLQFMDDHPDAGSLGVKMIDGRGQFLPESKRALPTPWVAFYRMFGISRLFPKSKKFGRYHLGHLDKNETHEIEVLAGAYMFMRKDALDEVGLLDEDYFMYGEDIDLSYRITQGGYKNYYFPDTTIIHYKGESTKKGSLNYVLVFYNAMIIFAKKHFSPRNARTYTFFINMAIYLRATMALTRRFVKQVYRQLLDAFIIYAGYLVGLNYWEQIKFNSTDYYAPQYMQFVVPIYILIWILSAYYSGSYDKPLRIIKHFRGLLIGSILILVAYAILPDSLRFSRALILFGSAWAVIGTGLFRWLMHLLKMEDYSFEMNRKRKIAIVGDSLEAKRVADLLEQTQINPNIIGIISPEQNNDNSYMGSLDQLSEIVRIHQLDEILFCAENLSSAKIIHLMASLSNSQVSYKIAPPESMSVIGSNSINTAGDLYTIHINSIGKQTNKRSKRLLDISVSLSLLLSFPLWLCFVKRPFHAWSQLLSVSIGMKSMVGYCHHESIDLSELPKIRKGILNPATLLSGKKENTELINKANMLYAKDYSVGSDIQIIWKGFQKLGIS